MTPVSHAGACATSWTRRCTGRDRRRAGPRVRARSRPVLQAAACGGDSLVVPARAERSAAIRPGAPAGAAPRQPRCHRAYAPHLSEPDLCADCHIPAAAHEAPLDGLVQGGADRWFGVVVPGRVDQPVTGLQSLQNQPGGLIGIVTAGAEANRRQDERLGTGSRQDGRNADRL
eukprot:scaffold16924_cov120-Isochrysis_galbana.AAC.2